jgi:Domain of unknown function (DUF3471)/Domain of unknown function (DUF4440)
MGDRQSGKARGNDILAGFVNCEGLMRKPISAFLLFLFGVLATGLTLIGSTACDAKNTITQDELARRAQELFDSVAAGDQGPWKKYVADDALYFDEKGANMNKAQLVATVTPLPKGYSGIIKVVNPKSHIEGDIAILSYDLDETEIIFGQNLTARYHLTDTWMRRNGQYQIIAGQAFRYYEDPAPGKVDSTKLDQYVGTYELAPENRLTILMDGGQLYRQRGEQPRALLIPEATDIFFRKGVEGRIVFRHDDDGKVNALLDRRNNEDVVWKKVQ